MSIQLDANEAARRIVRSAFLSKQRKNSSYSLRALAKQLKVDQSLLSKFLKGERQFSIKVIENLSLKLGLSPKDIQKMVRGTPPTKYASLQDDQFHLIADWYHFAILELFKTKSFDPNPARIAEQFGLHVEEARAALDRLQRLKMIDLMASPPQLLSPNNSWANLKNTTEARLRLQKEFIKRSLKSIDEDDFELRDHGSLTVAINRSRLPEFKEKLTEVRRQLSDFFQSDSDLDEVYQFTISLFPLTKTKTLKKGMPA